MNIRIKSLLCAVGVSIAASASVQAGPIGVYEMSTFINSSNLNGGTSLQDTQIGSGANEFGSAGLGVTYVSSLDANNVGTMSWSITNNTGVDLLDTTFFGFLDADIDEPINSFFDETGSAAGLSLGAGSSDSAADFWEIDEPGYETGDIFTNLLAGNLDNSVGTASDDISLALGFDIGTLLAGQTLVAVFDISLMSNGGLEQFDTGVNSFFFNGAASTTQVGKVPVPAPLFLIGLGLIGVSFFGRRKQV